MASGYIFQAADYAIFVGMLASSIAIGIYYARSGGKQTSTLEYFLGNRRLKMLPVAISLLVSFQSSVFVLGYPAEVYIHGSLIIWYEIGLVVTGIIAARITVPLLHPLKLTSAFEYFEVRYRSKAPRLLGTIIGILFYILYIGIVLYGSGIALKAVTDVPFWASVLSAIMSAMLYTSMGGLKTVIWTDVVQCVIMFLGLFAVIIKGVIDVGGVKEVAQINLEYLRLNYFEFNPDPTVPQTFWTLMFSAFIGDSSLIFSQSTIQRISSVNAERTAKKIMYAIGPAFLLMGILANIEGLIMFAYFNVIGCDPIKAGYIENPSQLLPYMVVRIFKGVPGLAGLYFAALFSASLSTISSGLSSLSLQTVEDFIKPKFKNMTDRKTTSIAKISVLFYGLLSFAVTVLIANIPGSLIQISVSAMSSASGPLTGVFLYSALCPWATKKGFLLGGAISFAFVLWINLGQNFISGYPRQPWLPMNPLHSCPLNMTTISNVYNDTASRIADYEREMTIYRNTKPQGIDKLYAISFRWLSTIGVLLAIFSGSVVSFLTGHPSSSEVDVKYIVPLGDQLFPYLPKRARKILDFGVDFNKRRLWLKMHKQSTEENEANDIDHYEINALNEDSI